MMRWIASTIVAAALALPQRLDAQLPVQGVKVHGHWVIEVRNADGTLKERRDFENALHSDGSLVLGGLLNRQPELNGLTGTFWGVVLRLSPTSSNLCASGTPTQVVCVTESGHPGTGGHLFKTLSRTLNGSTGAFVLKGSVVLADAATIVTVGTTVGTDQFEFRFTSTDLSSPISVEATQTVSVTVTISFS